MAAPVPFYRSLIFRQAFATIFIVLLCVGVFAALAIDTVAHVLRADLLHTVDTDIAGLTDLAQQGNMDDLAARIAERADVSTGWDAKPWYLLQAPDGAMRAGNLRGPAPLRAALSESGMTVVGGVSMMARATVLRGGWQLTVGRSTDRIDALEATLRVRLLIAAAVLGALVLFIAALIARDVRGRIDGLNRVFARFERGDLDARPAIAASRDELSLLEAHTNRHLERSAAFVGAQRRISDGIAHELRTPLVHLDTRLVRLGEKLDPSSGNLAEIDAARGDIRRIVSLFDMLLDIALSESLEEARSERFSLSELVGNVADLYAASAEEAGLAFTARIAPDVELFGEPMQITRLLANLLDNALKFVPAGCSLRLTLSPGPELVVEDNGPGIPEDAREQIFQRFARVGGNSRGHGLGLALVRVIAARHGLTIHVEDANPGARFVVQRRDA